jgi:Inner membrane protein YgaP-like, transmembrane domain
MWDSTSEKDSTSDSRNKEDSSSSGMRQNLGNVDRYIRLTAGLFLAGSALAARRQTASSRALLAIGSMSAAEGILGWCPIMHLLGIRDTTGAVGTARKSSSSDSRSDSQSRQEETLTDSIHKQHEKKNPPTEAKTGSAQMAEKSSQLRDSLVDDATADINTSFQ